MVARVDQWLPPPEDEDPNEECALLLVERLPKADPNPPSLPELNEVPGVLVVMPLLESVLFVFGCAADPEFCC